MEVEENLIFILRMEVENFISFFGWWWRRIQNGFSLLNSFGHGCGGFSECATVFRRHQQSMTVIEDQQDEMTRMQVQLKVWTS